MKNFQRKMQSTEQCYKTDFKATIVTMFHGVKVINTFKINGKIDVLRRDIETVKKNKIENFKTITVIYIKDSLR